MSQAGASRALLGQVVEDVGGTFFDGIVGRLDPARAVAHVVILDGDDDVLPPDAVVLGVGLHDLEAITPVLTRLAKVQAAALVVREPVANLRRLEPLAREHSVPILALTRGASWSQVAALLRAVVHDTPGAIEPESAVLGGVALGDLFGVANSLAALVDAPILIEDRRGHVLAFSGRQDEADRSRVESILGRQVPEGTLRAQTSKGIFRELYASEGPIWVDPRSHPAQTMARTVMAVRAGGEVLGSIWVAVREPLSPERTRALVDGAQLVALHLLHQRAGADAARRARSALLGEVLSGGPTAADAAARLGLGTGPHLVATLATLSALTIDPVRTTDPARTTGSRTTNDVDAATAAAERQRLADAFAMHLDVVAPGSVTATQGEVVHAVVPARGPDPQGSTTRVAEEFLRRISSSLEAVVAIGPAVTEPAGLPRSAAQAQRVLRVLRAGRSPLRVATLRDVQTEALLTELGDLMRERGEPPLGPLTALREHDTERDGRLVETLRAWLEAFGDVNAAAAAIYVHPNTFRYRLRRAAQIAGIDLGDPDDRFAAMLQLRLADRTN